MMRTVLILVLCALLGLVAWGMMKDAEERTGKPRSVGSISV